MNSISEFEQFLSEDMKELFGECIKRGDVLRSLVENMGVTNSSVIFEAAFETDMDPETLYPVLHFHTTLAQNIEDELVPKIVMGLNELNTAISAGAFPAFGCFGYYAPLQQVYLSYRMPVNLEAPEAERQNIRFYLGSLYDQLDLFVDFVLFLCEDPETITLEEYMDYLDSITDLNNIDLRIKALEKYLEELEKEGTKEE